MRNLRLAVCAAAGMIVLCVIGIYLETKTHADLDRERLQILKDLRLDNERIRKDIRDIKLNNLLAHGASVTVKVPRIIHQSWKNTKVPPRFAYWRKSWFKCFPEPTWQHVLWTDKDNEHLVRQEFPQYYAYYKKLPQEIYRADMVSAPVLVRRCSSGWGGGGGQGAGG